MAQRNTIMKAKVLLAAVAMMAMLMPGNAVARDNKVRHCNGNLKHRTEMRLVKNHRPVVLHHVAHRPGIGTRFDRCPTHGRFVNHNHERLWLADGILYRVIRTPHGVAYVVVGYWS